MATRPLYERYSMFFKVNVLGEEAFLAKADDAVARFRGA